MPTPNLPASGTLPPIATGTVITLPDGYEGEHAKTLDAPRIAVVDVVSACGKYAAIYCRKKGAGAKKFRRELIETSRLKRAPKFIAGRKFTAHSGKEFEERVCLGGWIVSVVVHKQQ